MHPHFGYLTFDRLPVAEASCFNLPKTCGDSNLCALIGKRIEPDDELLCLTDREHAENVSNWILNVKCPAELSSPIQTTTEPAPWSSSTPYSA